MTDPNRDFTNAPGYQRGGPTIGTLPVEAGVYLSSKQVESLHRNADVDRRPESMHHSLGLGHSQAAFGDHVHNGVDSATLFGKTIKPDGTIGNAQYSTFNQDLTKLNRDQDALNQVINLLTSLGAVNQTQNLAANPSNNKLPLVPLTFAQNLASQQGQKDAIKSILGVLVYHGMAVDNTTLSGQYIEIETGTIVPTWTVAGTVSPDTTITFTAGRFSSSPRMFYSRVASSAQAVVEARTKTGGTSTNVMWAVSDVSQAIGFNATFSWVGINLVNYT